MPNFDRTPIPETVMREVADQILAAEQAEAIHALRQAGATVSVEWGVRYVGDEPTDDPDRWSDAGTREAAAGTIAARERRGWWTPSVLIRRYVITTAATVVGQPSAGQEQP